MATTYFSIGYKDKLPDIMKRDGFSHFEISDAKDKLMVYCPSGYSVEDAANYLKESLDGIQEGEFNVSLFQSDKKKANNKTFAFKIPAVQQISGVSNYSKEIAEKEKALDKREFEWNLQRMLDERDAKHKAEIDALKENSSSGIMGVLDNLQNVIDKYPVIGNLLNHYLMPKEAAINGVDSEMDRDLQRIASIIGGDDALKQLVKGVADQVTGSRGLEFMIKLQTFIKQFDGEKV